MIDRPPKRLLKALVRLVVLADLRLWRAVARRRGDARWTLGGDCGQCAKCCESPSITVDRVTWHLPTARRLFLWWQLVVNGFELTGTERPRTFVFRCSHFDPATRRCDSYASRPAMCRDYPRLLLHQPWPELLPGCGYRVVDSKGAGLLVALGTSKLTEAQREALATKLRLK